MPRPVLKTIVFAAALASPLAAGAQENSIMQSFHPEKYPAPKAQAGTQTEPDHPKEAGAARQIAPEEKGKLGGPRL